MLVSRARTWDYKKREGRAGQVWMGTVSDYLHYAVGTRFATRRYITARSSCVSVE
jgi:hypothetical protein